MSLIQLETHSEIGVGAPPRELVLKRLLVANSLQKSAEAARNALEIVVKSLGVSGPDSSTRRIAELAGVLERYAR